ncbi:MAG: zf-HC2 domain-containing protein [Gammaproteobacteria bacterium]|nr:zf-HC2 domain-containing protein [Gammaproteobacteria bacterium]
MLSCKDTSELVSRSLDEELSWRQRIAVRLHLLICGACRRFVAQMGFIRRAARRYPGGAGGRDQGSR